MTKAKRSASLSYTRYFLTRFFAMIAVFLGAPFCGLYGYMSFGYLETSIDPVLVPTAKYLYEHPQPTPDFVQFDPMRYAPQSLCYSTTISFWTQVFLNGVRIPPDAFFIYPRADETSRWGTYCLDDRELPPGLYLAEIHQRVNLWDATQSYQWAIKVEE
jgi:hypothetical protein